MEVQEEAREKFLLLLSLLSLEANAVSTAIADFARKLYCGKREISGYVRGERETSRKYNVRRRPASALAREWWKRRRWCRWLVQEAARGKFVLFIVVAVTLVANVVSAAMACFAGTLYS